MEVEERSRLAALKEAVACLAQQAVAPGGAWPLKWREEPHLSLLLLTWLPATLYNKPWRILGERESPPLPRPHQQ